MAKDVLFPMDSNRKILDNGRLWDPSVSSVVPASTLIDVLKLLPQYITPRTKCLILHCGTNDLDRYSPTEVCDLFHECLQKALELNPTMRVVISELLPRRGDMDQCVKMVNSNLNQELSRDSSVFLLSNDKFRDYPSFYLADDRHLKKEAAPILAAGLRHAVRVCTSTKPAKPKNNQGKDDLCAKLINAIKSCF